MDILITYRLEQAYETLNEAETLLNATAFRGTINRTYYAMFYALLALLATQQFSISKHSSALSLFDREFVKTGIFPRNLSRSLHLAFDLRQTHDYGEMIEVDHATAASVLAAARTFVEAIASYLHSTGHLSSKRKTSE